MCRDYRGVALSDVGDRAVQHGVPPEERIRQIPQMMM
jgi:hypothetical protein